MMIYAKQANSYQVICIISKEGYTLNIMSEVRNDHFSIGFRGEEEEKT